MDSNTTKHQIVCRLLVFVLNYLDQLPDGISIVSEIIRLLDYAPHTDYKPIYNYAKSFYDKHSEFPSLEYLQGDFPDSSLWVYKIDKEAIPYNFESVAELLRHLKEYRISELAQQAARDYDIDKLRELASEETEVICEDEDEGMCTIYADYEVSESRPQGLLTGINELDYWMQGMDYGTLNVVAAPTGAGKTSYAVATAYNAVINSGKKVLYITLEVTPTRIKYNMASRHSVTLNKEISATDLKKTKLTVNEKCKLRDVQDDFVQTCQKNGGDFRVIGADKIKEYSKASLEALLLKYRSLMGGLDVVYLDQINLLKTCIPKGVKVDGYEVLNYYTQVFTQLAVKHEFVMVMLCQINRQGTDKLHAQNKEDTDSDDKAAPTTTFFAEANEVERSASTAVILYSNPFLRNQGMAKLYMVKNRDAACPENSLTTIFKPEFYIMGEGLNPFAQNQLPLHYDTSEDEAQIEVEGQSLDMSELADGIDFFVPEKEEILSQYEISLEVEQDDE